MTEFSKPVLKELRKQLQTLLDNSKYIGTAKGLNDYTFELGNCSYDGGEATFKLKVLIDGAESSEEKHLRQMALLMGLDTSKIATLQSMRVSLVSYNARARKRPWVVQNLKTGQKYIIDDDTAKRLFGKVEEVS